MQMFLAIGKKSFLKSFYVNTEAKPYIDIRLLGCHCKILGCHLTPTNPLKNSVDCYIGFPRFSTKKNTDINNDPLHVSYLCHAANCVSIVQKYIWR